jgi:LmbE family N-acetylglucosaminyl deacetylase
MITAPHLSLIKHNSVTVLSPHLDDAVLSCGALLAACRERALSATVITMFNGLPEGNLSAPAREFHRRCGLGDDAVSLREIEDSEALRRLGASTIRLDLPEALYRRDATGKHAYADEHALFSSMLDKERDLVMGLACRMAEEPLIKEVDLLFAPIGVGNHIDHLVVAAATAQLKRLVHWYEEVPYVLFDRCRGWQEEHRVSDDCVFVPSWSEWHAKLDAIRCYASQQNILWEEPECWDVNLTTFASGLGNGRPAERYWRGRPWRPYDPYCT